MAKKPEEQPVKPLKALKGRDNQPSATDRAELVQRLRDRGIPAARVTAAVRSGRTRKEMMDDLIVWLRDLPRQKK